ncbi:MAG: AAA family ATPase, partial [Hyphomicrobium sp.]
LLEILSDFQVTVPEIGTIKAKTPPYVVITSNNTRDLSDALKRRCLHLFIDYPDEQRELQIIRLKVPGVSEALATQVVNVIRRMRALDLRKAPSISETLDWAQALVLLNAEHLTHDLVEETLQLLVKYERDTQQVREHVAWLLEGVDGHGHSHDHDHPDSHSHEHSHEHGHTHPAHHESPQHNDRPGGKAQAQILRPPPRPAEPDLKDVESRKQEHAVRYFGRYRGRVDGGIGDA